MPVASHMVLRVSILVGCRRWQVVCMHSPWMASFRKVSGGSLRCMRRLSLLCMFMLWRKSVMFHRPHSVKQMSNYWIAWGWVRLCAACSHCCFGGSWCERALFPCCLLGFPTVAAVSTWSRAAIT